MATQEEKNLVKNIGKVYYLEPNDILGKVDNRPITPDYSDYCVSFKLTGEIIRRTRYNGYEGEIDKGKTFTIGWIGSNKEYGETYVDVTGGSELGENKKRYLTTYYTDINYQDFSKHNVVEGLGVESIDIQFKEQYTPTIVIKFVDVRGSALFGRDEAIHKDGIITADNIFGCFFTVPYPKFRLQIKGFYGREVTYQLYCSSFKGNFNAQTGNFEATVTFLGYVYGVLADVPMAYLMAAPYCSYIGSDYWNKQYESNPDWTLYETAIGFSGKAIKLYELKENINSAVRGDRTYFTSLLNNLEKKELFDNTYKIDVAKGLVRSYVKILISIRDVYGELNLNGKKYETKELKKEPKEEEIKQKCENFIKEYNNYLKEYNNLLNASFEGFDFEKNIVVKKIVSQNGDKNYVISIDVTEAVESTNSTIDLSQEIIEDVEKTANENSATLTIKNLIGIYPYIGNVIKNTLFHLETFMKMLSVCVGEVLSQNEDRTFEKLKIPVQNTDCKNIDDNNAIPPFPSIMVFEQNEEPSDENQTSETQKQSLMKNIGWLGDFTDDAPEVRLVNSIFEAMRRRGYDKEETTTGESEEEETKRDRDIKVAIYVHLKNIYDRWLINDEFEEYKVKNYYKNFIFIDSFYRDISYLLHVNPEKLGNLLESVSRDEGRLLKYISTIVSDTHCLMFGFPNTFLFKEEEAIKSGLISAFKPYPYSQIENMETSNKFVIIYTYKPSEIIKNNNGYRGDYFDVYSDGDVLPANMPIQLRESGYGYNIPSFGVAFGRQDNAIFKSFKLSMDNPVTTEQVIKALSLLAEKSGVSKSKIQYYGQDLYQVWSGYSYFCDFEMMGDVQIMPLMYFQLLNVPMFRGAYMIINVSHTMRQGEMITSVRGMRMSRNALPLTKAWFTPELVIKFDDSGGIENLNELIGKLVSDESNYEYFGDDYLPDASWKEMINRSDLEKTKWLTGYESRKALRASVPYESDGSGKFVCSDKDGWEKKHINNYTFTDGPLKGVTIEINKRFTEGGESSWVKTFEKAFKDLYEGTEYADSFNKNNLYFYSYRPINCKDGNELSNHSFGAAFDICAICNKAPSGVGSISPSETITEKNNKVKLAIEKPIGNGYWYEKSENYNYSEHNWLGIKDVYDASYNNVIKNTTIVPSQENEINPLFIRKEEHKFVKAMKDLGFGWGGKYGDTMHFSFFGGN